MRRRTPKFCIETSKIIPDLWLSAFFCPINNKKTLNPIPILHECAHWPNFEAIWQSSTSVWKLAKFCKTLFIHVLHLCGHWPNFGDTVFDKIVLFNSVTHAILNIILDPGQSLQQSTNKSVVFNPVLILHTSVWKVAKSWNNLTNWSYLALFIISVKVAITYLTEFLFSAQLCISMICDYVLMSVNCQSMPVLGPYRLYTDISHESLKIVVKKIIIFIVFETKHFTLLVDIALLTREANIS